MNDSVDQIVCLVQERLKKGKSFVLALDGRSGVGKSTISKLLAKRLSALLILCDDFYTGGSDEHWNMMTPKEKVDAGIDWKRLRRQVIEPLLAGKSAKWQTFNWETQDGLSDTFLSAEPSQIIILDGIYSARPELGDIVDLSILLTFSDEALRQRRLDEREGEQRMQAWHNIWDEAEDYYFEHMKLSESFDVRLELA